MNGKWKKWEKGVALVFSFMLLILVAAFSMTMQEVSHSSRKLSFAITELKDAEINAKLGVSFFVQRFNQLELAGQNVDTWLGSLTLPKKYSLGPQNGWFQLDAYQKAGMGSYAFKYQMDISAGVNESLALAEPSLPGLVNTAYAQSAPMVQFRVIITAVSTDGSSLGFTSEVTPKVDGTNITASSYPASGQYNAPNLGSPDNITLDGTLSHNSSGADISANMNRIVQELTNVIGAAKTLADSPPVAYTKPSAPPAYSGSNVTIPPSDGTEGDYTSFVTTYTHSHSHSKYHHYHSGSYYQDHSHSHTNTTTHLQYTANNSNVTIGAPGQFSYMKFYDLTLGGNGSKVRIYPGIYQFRKFTISGDHGSVYLDTTTGPIYIMSRGHLSEIKVTGNNNGVMVFKDNTYSGNDVMGNPVNPTANANLFASYDNKVDKANAGNGTIGPAGRKSAYFLNADPWGYDKEAWVSGNNNIVCGFAVGDGGNTSVGMPTTIETNNGSEMTGDPNAFGNPGWALASAQPTTDHFRIFSGQYGEIRFLGNNNAMIGIFYGTECSYHSTEFEIKGNNNVLYGAISHKGKVSLDGNNISLNFDSRITPFPPKPLEGTRHSEYLIRLQ